MIQLKTIEISRIAFQSNPLNVICIIKEFNEESENCSQLGCWVKSHGDAKCKHSVYNSVRLPKVNE